MAEVHDFICFSVFLVSADNIRCRQDLRGTSSLEGVAVLNRFSNLALLLQGSLSGGGGEGAVERKASDIC